MKKQYMAAVLCLLLLAGCAPRAEEAPAVTVPETAATVPATAVKETEPATIPTEPPEETQALLQPEPSEDDFVPVLDYIPDAVVELRYATQENFTGQIIYETDALWLRYGTVKKLMAVRSALAEQGLGLKFWDGFRPVAAQFRLWEICPDPVYVADPNRGFSSHSRGNTVDITLVDAQGRELTMPAAFDDFSALANRDYSDCPAEAAENARLLERVMEENGFRPYWGEWWHFTDSGDYPVAENFSPVIPEERYALCREFISLRLAPDTAAEVITRIPAGERVTVIARWGDFFKVRYKNLTGYVLAEFTSSMN